MNQEKSFKALGTKLRGLRRRRGDSQEDMIFYGLSARHWQQIEAGRPITTTTFLRICEVFAVPMTSVVRGLDAGGYEKPTVQPPFRKRR